MDGEEELAVVPPLAGRATSRSRSFSQVLNATPLPKTQMFLVLLIQITEALQMCALFPFLVFMVSDFGFSDKDLGFYAGLLAACFCGTQLLSSTPIGWLSDRWGRKKVLMLGCGGSAIAILIFGSAKTFAQAVVGRMISGALNGNVGVLKSFLGEITDDSNVGLAFSYLSGGWGLGVIIAPIIGGLFAKPAESHNDIGATFGTMWLFREYPYLLPCVVVSAFQLVTLLLTASLMIEPQVHRERMRARCNTSANSNGGNSDRVVTSSSSLVVEEEELKGGPDSGGDDRPQITTTTPMIKTLEGGERARNWTSKWVKHHDSEITLPESLDSIIIDDQGVSSSSSTPQKEQPPPLSSREILRSRDVLLSSTGYGLTCMIFIVFDETIPLLCKLEPSQGGFGFSTQQIGTLLSIGGVGLAFMSLVLFPFLHARFGSFPVFRWALVLSMPVALCWPFQAWITSTTIVWTSLALMVTAKAILTQACFNPIMIIVNNSAPRSHLGAVNGLGQSLGSGARGVGPALGGVLWSLGIRAHFIYLNFIFIAICLLATLALSYLLPPSLDNQKDEPRERPRLVAPSSSRRSGGGSGNHGGSAMVSMEVEV